MGIKQTLVVIGNGMVGQHFLASFVTGSGKNEYEIVTFCEEPRPAYDRVHLSDFFFRQNRRRLITGRFKFL